MCMDGRTELVGSLDIGSGSAVQRAIQIRAQLHLGMQEDSAFKAPSQKKGIRISEVALGRVRF
jgi:hypothetical protein